MKILVETTGDFMLIDRQQDLAIECDRPAVTERTPFVHVQIGLGQLHVLSELQEAATDEEFQKYVTDSEDMDLAVASFVAAFGPDTTTKKTTRRGRRKVQDEGTD